MSLSLRTFLRMVSASLALLSVGLLLWWSTRPPDTSAAAGARPLVDRVESVDGESAGATGGGAATPAEAIATPSSVPTATPQPTPTPIPIPFEEFLRADLVPLLVNPIGDCSLVGDASTVAGTVGLRCLEPWSSVPVRAAAGGRVVVVNESAAWAAAEPQVADAPGVWSWTSQAALGPHVVVDHGPLGEFSNVQTVYAGLDSIGPGIRIGEALLSGDEIGTLAGPEATLRFSVWSDDSRQDGVSVLASAPDADEQRRIAAALGELIVTPTDPRCPLSLGLTALPGAARPYRNGTHRGIDFGCGAADRSGFAIADGTVAYVVDAYEDPTVPEREALLANAGRAGFTPHWTLVMLYGNVVVVDHGEMPGVGRVVTITAHLESVDPAITIGASVAKGQRLGELGNRGTNASALGVRGSADPSLHLHWELMIDNWFLGAGLDTAAVTEVVQLALCSAATTPGCPA